MAVIDISVKNHSSVALDPKHRLQRFKYSKGCTPMQTNRDREPNRAVGTSSFSARNILFLLNDIVC